MPRRLLALAAALMIATACAKPGPPPAAASSPIPVDGKSAKLDAVDTHKYLQYGVAIHIDAPPERVWAVLTDAERYPEWNSTVKSVQGRIDAAQTIKLVAHIAPKRTFKLLISDFQPGARLVWEDGNNAFKGVRTFTLTPSGDGTDIQMVEAYNGAMVKMIAPKLPDLGPDFEAFAADLKAEAEAGA